MGEWGNGRGAANEGALPGPTPPLSRSSSLPFLHSSPPLPLRLVIHPQPRGAKDQQRQREDDGKQDPGERGAVADLELFKRLSVEVEAVEERRVFRPRGAREEDEGGGEDLERANDPHHE